MSKKIGGGYVLQPRKITKSDIWNKPPYYYKIWTYLCMKATHQDYGGLKRGQCIVTIKELQEQCSFMKGYVKEMPTTRQVRSVLDYLKSGYESHTERNNEGHMNESMIVTTKVTTGTLVTIVNYNVYQDPSLYESDNERNNENPTKVIRDVLKRKTINKNNNNNNNNNYIYNSQQKLKEWKIENPMPTPDKFSDMKEFTKSYKEWTEKKNEILKEK